MRRPTLTILLYLGLVFASGIVVGAFGYRLASGPAVIAKAPARISPEEFRRQYFSEMQDRLNLTPAQVDQLNAILDDSGARVQAARSRSNAEMRSIREHQIQQVRDMLSSEQRPKYDQLRAERDQRFRSFQNRQKKK